MGKVKTDQIKRAGKTLMARFPEKFSTVFEDNKHAVDALTQGTSTRVRNQIAGYITRTVSIAQGGFSGEPDEEGEEE